MSQELSDQQKEQCTDHDYDFSHLSALFINCTLKPSQQQSHTRGLIDLSKAIMDANDVTTNVIRAVDHDIPPGVQPDMTNSGASSDDWPDIFEQVMQADILVIGSPIWLGEKSSVCNRIIERLYGNSHLHNDKEQYTYYGKTAGCLITGNEDGVKHCSMSILYALQHVGYTIPPQADAGWIGEIGPGPSYLDPESDAENNDFTNRNTTFMTWNLMHTAFMLTKNNGVPAHGNVPDEWDAGCDVNFPNPEHR